MRGQSYDAHLISSPLPPSKYVCQMWAINWNNQMKYSTSGDVWRQLEVLILATPGLVWVIESIYRPSHRPRIALNQKKIFFYHIFSKYCKLEEVVHPSSLLGCSRPTERFFLMWIRIYSVCLWFRRFSLICFYSLCLWICLLCFHFGTFERFAKKDNW